MKPAVAHFLRKYSQLKASFIKNQVENHKNFTPVVIYKIVVHKTEGGFAAINEIKYPTLVLSENENLLAKLKFKFLKLISNMDVISIKQFLVDHNVKVLHFHFGTDAGIYFPLLKKIKIPSVVSFYGYDCSSFVKYLGGYGKIYLRRRVFPHVTKVLAMSPAMKNDLIKIGCPENKIIVHHHGNDVNKFFFQRNYEVKDRPVKFLILSALTPTKGHIFILESMQSLISRNKNISLTIVGDGPLRKNIEEKIAENHLEPFVNLESSVVYSSDEHFQYLKTHDIFIHPCTIDHEGSIEGIPGAIVEAMASGFPVISTFHGGIPYIIENKKSGLLVKEFDHDALADAMLKLSDDQSLRTKLGLAGQAFAIEQLNLSKREEELEKIYQSFY
jgi:colanic acid/amylovoran biosynthesis glycosyltransferase